MYRSKIAGDAPSTFTASRREIIWEAAIQLFIERGYDETTVDEVAQAPGIPSFDTSQRKGI